MSEGANVLFTSQVVAETEVFWNGAGLKLSRNHELLELVM